MAEISTSSPFSRASLRAVPRVLWRGQVLVLSRPGLWPVIGGTAPSMLHHQRLVAARMPMFLNSARRGQQEAEFGLVSPEKFLTMVGGIPSSHSRAKVPPLRSTSRVPAGRVPRSLCCAVKVQVGSANTWRLHRGNDASKSVPETIPPQRAPIPDSSCFPIRFGYGISFPPGRR